MEKLKIGIGKIKNLFEKDEIDDAKEYVYKSLGKFKSYYKDFKNTFKNDFEKVQKGNLTEHNRDFLWFFCLDILPYDQPSNWKKIITDLRSDYLSLKIGIITKEIDDFIILNDEKGSKNYDICKDKLKEEDFQLLDLIKIDIERTYSNTELFTKEKVKKIMAYVLFIYSKKNPLIGYKQGMNEICAIFLYALYKQYRLTTLFTKDEYSFLYFIFHSNNDFLENDLYLMYSSFMNKGIGELYLYAQYKQSKLSLIPLDKKIYLTKEEIYNTNDSQIQKRMYYIFYVLLKNFDIKFYNEMINKIEPELFLFKWYLCFLTREFTINNVVHLWDLILCYDFIEYKLNDSESNNENHFRLIDSIILSMILCYKNDLMKLKNEKDSVFMDLLVHYPEKIKIEQIIKEALKIDSKLNQDKIIDYNKVDEILTKSISDSE